MGQDAAELPTYAPTRARFLRLSWLRLPDPITLTSARRPLPWRDALTPAIAMWLATRIAYLVLTYFYPLVSGGEAPSSAPISLPLLFRRWGQWDGVWYIHIARMGYTTTNDTAFFPLYPGAIRLVAALSGPHWTAAALLVSNLGALLAFIGVAVLAAQIAPSGDEAAHARVAVTLFAAYPLAFFLFAAYSDGLFAGLAALALFFGLRRHWGWAALCGLLAAFCRPVGMALILPLAWEAFQRYRERRAAVSAGLALRDVAPALPAIFAPIAGLGAYCVFLWVRFDDPLDLHPCRKRLDAHIPLTAALDTACHPRARAHDAILPISDAGATRPGSRPRWRRSDAGRGAPRAGRVDALSALNPLSHYF